MIAALPMYDRPELRAATNALWAAIRDALRGQGIAPPDTLTRSDDLWAIWRDPGLVLAQTCGLPFRAALHSHVHLVATPDYGLPGCAPGYYNSVLIARGAHLPARPRVAVNDLLSQSGWAALQGWMTAQGIDHDAALITGSHAQSVQAVAGGMADLAAIDAQTWRILLRHGGADQALEIARTQPVPGLPLITSLANDPALIRAALTQAMGMLSPAVLTALDLRGFVRIDADAYLAIPLPHNL